MAARSGTPRRSGVVIALPVAHDRKTALSACVGHAHAADRFAEGEGDVIAVFGFGDGANEIALSVWAIGSSAVAERPDISRILGSPVEDALRLDLFMPAYTDAAIATEVLLIRVANDLATTFGGIVCDDIGAVYDPARLAAMAAAGEPRELSFAFASAAALRVRELTTRDRQPAPIAFEQLDEGDVLADSAPDIALDGASIFVVTGPNVPLVVASRIAAVATRTSMPLVVFAPQIASAQARVLDAANVRVVADAPSLASMIDVVSAGTSPARLVPDIDVARSEILLASTRAIEANAVRALLEHPRGSDTDDRAMRFERPDAATDVYVIDIDSAHPLIRELVASRDDLIASIDDRIRTLVVCESTFRDDRAATNADALAVSLLARVARAGDVAQDDTGALLSESDLARLAADRAETKQPEPKIG